MNLREIFEHELHRKLSMRANTVNSEINILMNAFRFYDLNDLGLISKEDFTKVFGRIGLNGMTPNYLYSVFDSYDINGIGYLNYTNLIEYLYDISPFQPLTKIPINLQNNDNNNGINNLQQFQNNNIQNPIINYNQFNYIQNQKFQNPIQSNYQNNLNQSMKNIYTPSLTYEENIQTPISNFNNLYKSQEIKSNIQPIIQQRMESPIQQSQLFKSITPLNNSYSNQKNYSFNQNYINYSKYLENQKSMNQKSSLIQNNIFLTDNYSTKKTSILDNYKKNNNYDIINHITNRNNQQDEINSQTGRLKYYFKYILQLFQSKINTNNGITYYTLISKMKNKQDYFNKTISFENFKTSLQESNIFIRNNIIQYFYSFIDKNGQNNISTEEILSKIRGKLNERRKFKIIEKFTKIDIDKKGYSEISLIKSLFNPNLHPEVKSGKRNESDILNEFIFTFDSYINYKDRISQISLEDFIEYYSGISASIADDDYFIDIMNGVWDISNNSFLQKINPEYLNNSNQENIETSDKINEKDMNILTPIKEENNINNITLKKYNKRSFSNNNFRTLNKKTGKSYNILTGYFDDENNIFVNNINGNENINFTTSNNNNSDYYLVNKLRNILISKGPKSLFVIEKMLSMYDNNKTGKIDLSTLIKIFETYKISISEEEIEKIFSHFDFDNTGMIKYDNLISSIVGSMSIRRENLIKKVYNLISTNNTFDIPLINIIKSYISSRHPDVISGKRISEDVLQEFADNLNIFKDYINSIKKNESDRLNYEDFIKFYSQISMYISDNNYFEMLIKNVWNLDGGDTYHFYNFGNKFGRKNRIKSASDYKNKYL